MRSAQKSRAWLWLIILMPVATVATIGLVVGMGMVFNASGESEPILASERALLLDIEHVAGWMERFERVETAERISKTRYFDGSYELEYVYDAGDGDGAPFLTYSVTFEGNERDAGTTFASFWGGTRFGFLVGEGDIEVESSDELMRWGDESNFGILTSEGRPFGNVFLARRGKRVVYFLLAGLYFDDGPVIQELFAPYLERLEAY